MSTVEQILYLLDTFCVSDEFYYELSMMENGLTRSYFIKQTKVEELFVEELFGFNSQSAGPKICIKLFTLSKMRETVILRCEV